MIQINIKEDDCYIEIESLSLPEKVKVTLHFPGLDQAQDIVTICSPEQARVFVAYHLAREVSDRASSLSDFLSYAGYCLSPTCNMGIQATEEAQGLQKLLSLWQNAAQMLGIEDPPTIEISWDVVPQTVRKLWKLKIQAQTIASKYIEQCI